MTGSLRPSSAAAVVLILALAAALAPACGRAIPRDSSPEQQAARFTSLMQSLQQAAEEASRLVGSAVGGPAGAEAFDRLLALQQSLSLDTAGRTSISVWERGGRPLAWAGEPGRPPSSQPDSLPAYTIDAAGALIRFQVLTPGPGDGLTRAELAFSSASRWHPDHVHRPGQARFRVHYHDEAATPFDASATLLRAPDDSILGHQEKLAAWSGHGLASRRWPPARLVVLGAIAALLAVLIIGQRRQREVPATMVAMALPAAAIIAVRVLFLALLPGPSNVTAGAMTGPSLYASSFLGGLYHSPADALLSGLTVLALSGILARQGRWALRRVRLRLMLLPAALGLCALAALMAMSAGRDSQMNLVVATVDAHTLPRMAVQFGLLFTLGGPLVLLMTLVRGARGGPIGITLPAFILSAVALYTIQAMALHAEQRDLVERNLMPQVLGQELDRLHALDESRRLLRDDPDLAAALEAALAVNRGDDLAYELWQRTEFARLGLRSSLELFSADGSLAGSFGVEMPPPVAAGAEPADNLVEAVAERTYFSTLSQEKEVFTSRWPLEIETLGVGGIALYVANEVDNVSWLRRPAWGGGPEPASGGHTENSWLGGEVLVMAYDSANRLIWSSYPDPPPLPAGMDAATAAGAGRWVDDTSAGHPVRLRYTGDGVRLYALGFHLDTFTGHLTRLLRLIQVLFAGVAALGLIAFLVLRQPPAAAAVLHRAVLAWRASYARRLATATLVACLPLLLLLALVQRASLERQRGQVLQALGLQSLEVAGRLVSDAVAAGYSRDGTAILPGDETLFWLSRVIRQDLDLFVGGLLAATSRRGAYTAGLLSPLPPAEVYVGATVAGQTGVLSVRTLAGVRQVSISGPLEMDSGPPAVLSLALDRQQAEVEARLSESRDLTGLAAAAIAILLVLASSLLGRGMSARLARLTRTTERLAQGDTTARVAAPPSPDEIGRLTASFDSMAEALARQQDALQRRTETLEKILLHAPTGIMLVDASGRLAMANPASPRLLRVAPHPQLGMELEALIKGSPFAAGLMELLTQPAGVSPYSEAELDAQSEGDGRLRAVLADLPGTSGGKLLILEDVTETIRSNKLAAWAEMARRIAHEIKNPLTPIRLSAEHLRRVHQQGDPCLGDTLVRSVETILEQVRILQDISSDFSLYARIPAIKKEPVDVAELLRQTLEPYRAAPPHGVKISAEIEPGLGVLDLDAGLMRRALVNLLENALQALPTGGQVVLAGRRGGDGSIFIQVRDTGRGMDEATRRRIFEPYFSTRDAGTGLGLAIAARSVEEHGGRIEVRSAPDAGSQFSISLPPTGGTA